MNDIFLTSEDGYTLLEITDKSIEKLVIPDYINYIDEFAFCDCINLKEIYLPSNSIYWHDSPFKFCPALECLNTDESNTKYKSVDGVLYSKNLYEIISFPCNHKSKDYTILDRITIIYEDAFTNCSALETLNIPRSVLHINDTSFDGCTSLKCINIEDGNSYYKSIDGVLFNNRLSTLIRFPYSHKDSIYTIPDKVEHIECDAFSDCINLISVDIPQSVHYIPAGAFCGCTNLKVIDLPESITYIDEGAFEDCTALTSIDLSRKLASIGKRAFQGCKSLVNIYLPDSIRKIEEGAFENCSSLKKIDLPQLLETIKANTFAGCSSLKSITIPSRTTEFYRSAWDNCYSLERIDVSENNPKFKSIDGVLFNKDASRIFYFPYNHQNTEYTIPSTVTIILNRAFEFCKKLNKLIIPDSVIIIGEDAFYGCSSLQSVKMSSNIRKIGYGAFSMCSALSNIELPDSLKKIEGSAFSHCSSLKAINLPYNIKYLGDQVFWDCTALTSINIPEGIDTIYAGTFEECSTLNTIEIPDNVKIIGFGAFNGCSSLNHIKISQNITRIDQNAFGGCTSLANIYLLCDDINSIKVTDTFDDVDFDNCVLHVPSGTRWEYRHHPIFGKFKNIITEENVSRNPKSATLIRMRDTNELDELPF